jgi:dienelactone hydrolase
MRSTCSSPRRRLPGAGLAGLAGLLTGVACTFVPAPSRPRPALPVCAPAATAAPVPDAVLLEREPRPDGWQRGSLAAAGETVRFQLRRAEAGPARPLVLLVPILAGGEDLLTGVARRLVDRGFDVAYCARVGAALKPPQRGPEIDELFRRTVLHQRILLRWLRQDAARPPAGWCVLGMSIGGMVATVVAALEPDLDGVAVCLSGGDLAGMLLDSSEARVHSWLDWRRSTDGVGDDHLEWELRQYLRHEPLRFAASVPTEKVLFVSAAFDTVVPRRHRDLLWEALGRPARMDVTLGHYTAALAIDPILAAAAAHFRARTRAAR